MRSIINILIAVLLASAALADATTVSGHIYKPTTGALVPNGKLVFQLQGCLGIPISENGYGTPPLSVPLTANGSGQVSGTVQGNDQIFCDNLLGQSYYSVRAYDAFGSLLSVTNYRLTDAGTFDPSTATALSSTGSPTNPPVLYNPVQQQGDIIVADPLGKPVRLPIGPAGTCLTSNGTTAVYAPCPTGGGGGGSGTLPSEQSVTVGTPTSTISLTGSIPSGSLVLIYDNGILQNPNVTISGTTVTLPYTAQTGDVISASIYSSGGFVPSAATFNVSSPGTTVSLPTGATTVYAVYYNGMVQDPTMYSVSGNVVTFNFTLQTGDAVFVTYS